jgi:mono/diheme cytochrome c family protein
MDVMRWGRDSLLLSLDLAMIAAAQGIDPSFDLTDPTFIAKGRALFHKRCPGRCHGPDGCEDMEAPIRTGKTHLTPWFVYNALVIDRPGTAMPSWVDRFSHEELWQLTAFVASLGDQARSGSR